MIQTGKTAFQPSERYFETLIDLLPCYLTLQDKDLKIFYANRRFIDDFGNREGSLCHAVYKGAMDQISKETPGLILLDVMMESFYSGFDIWRQMNADPELKKIPIIGISGMADELGVSVDPKEDHEYFNPDVFMDKPVDRNLLLKKIQELLEDS